MNYTQQQIKRSNRKKTATIAFIGVMAVLLILGVFVSFTPLGASASQISEIEVTYAADRKGHARIAAIDESYVMYYTTDSASLTRANPYVAPANNAYGADYFYKDSESGNDLSIYAIKKGDGSFEVCGWGASSGTAHLSKVFGKPMPATAEVELTLNSGERKYYGYINSILGSYCYCDKVGASGVVASNVYATIATSTDAAHDYQYLTSSGEETAVYGDILANGTIQITGYSSSAGGYNLKTLYGVAAPKVVSLPETPTAPAGKEFAGWYYDAAFTQAYIDGDIITTDTSLYAKFVDKVYTVTYVLNGSNHSSAQIIHGNKAENLAITVGTGKEFSGWYTDAACTQAFSFDTAITADTTLYGKIETIMCAVTFYVGTEVYATLNVPYGSTFQAYAVSAAADAATAQAILNVYNLGNFDTAAAIEEDTEVTATLNEGLLRWNNFGVWFMNNWQWLTACAGLLIVVIVGSVITFKKRR